MVGSSAGMVAAFGCVTACRALPLADVSGRKLPTMKGGGAWQVMHTALCATARASSRMCVELEA